jgi:hypothetical protein
MLDSGHIDSQFSNTLYSTYVRRLPNRLEGTKMFLRFATFGAISCLLIGTVAYASPVGTLDVTNCSGGGVTVTSNMIDWLPAGGPNGCIVTGTNTNVTYTGGGPLTSGVSGSILDLTFPTSLPIADFMTFFGNPDLHFALSGLGPGSNNVACSATLDPNNGSCSVFAGDPVILTPTSTGTTATLSAFGIVTDASPGTSSWLGQYTTQFPGVTPAQIQTTILGGGSVTNSYSGSFNIAITSVPEPISMSLVGAGLIALGIKRKVARRA